MNRDAPAVLLLTLMCLLGWPASASADSDNSLERGAWALEFQVRPTFLTGGDAGLGISFKRHMTDRNALRLGFSGWTTSEDGNESYFEERFLPDTLISNDMGFETSQENRNISLFAHFVRYIGMGDRIAAFLEAGPVIQRYDTNRDEVSYPQPGATVSRVEDAGEWRYGGEARAGFEWFLRTKLSVALHYGVWGVRTERKQTYTDVYRTEAGELWRRSYDRNFEGFSTGTSSAMFSVMAYW